MTALLHLTEQPFNHVVCPNRLPVSLWEGIERQAGFQVTLQTLHRGGIDDLILGTEGAHQLIGLSPAVPIEDRLQLRLDLLALALWHVTQHVLYLVYCTTLPLRRREAASGDRIQHGLPAICYPQVYLFHPTSNQVGQQVLPGGLVLAIPDGEAQHVTFAGRRDAHHRQNQHLVAFLIVDHREIRPIKDRDLATMSAYDLQQIGFRNLGPSYNYVGIRYGGLVLTWSSTAGAYTYCTSSVCGFVYASSLVK